MKKIILSLFISFISTATMATGTRTITGTVYESDGKTTAIGALVYRDGVTAFSTETDINGRFTLSDIPDTYDTLVVDLMGFAPYEIKLTPTQSDYTIILKGSDDYTIDESTVSQCSNREFPDKHISQCRFDSNVINDNNCTCCASVVCESNRYTPTKDDNGCAICQDLNGTPCDTKPANSDTSSKKWIGKKFICHIDTCISDRYKAVNSDNSDGVCQDQVDLDCDPGIANYGTAKYKWTENKLVCVVESCADGYVSLDNYKTCIESSGPCAEGEVEKIENATAGELRNGICHATACKPGFAPVDGLCENAIGKPCDTATPPLPLPKNAATGVRAMGEDGTEYCQVTTCAKDFQVSGNECIFNLTEDESKHRIDELTKNLEDMKAKENSLANRASGAVGIGAGGIGGMQIASALSEQRADADAAADMAAYLATFRCDWGAGEYVRGGEKNVTVGTTGQITNMYQEYMVLAADLKARKESLGMAPGIESEIIANSATSGLYDDESVGRGDGKFISLSDALSDPESSAATKLAEQTAATQKKLTTGAVVAGTGLVGSAVGNIITNTGKRATPNQANTILDKYNEMMKD